MWPGWIGTCVGCTTLLAVTAAYFLRRATTNAIVNNVEIENLWIA